MTAHFVAADPLFENGSGVDVSEGVPGGSPGLRNHSCRCSSPTVAGLVERHDGATFAECEPVTLGGVSPPCRQ
jgi:hypothetical protein